MYELALTLNRTVDELLYGSASFRPLTSLEFTTWYAFLKLRADRMKSK